MYSSKAMSISNAFVNKRHGLAIIWLGLVLIMFMYNHGWRTLLYTVFEWFTAEMFWALSMCFARYSKEWLFDRSCIVVIYYEWRNTAYSCISLNGQTLYHFSSLWKQIVDSLSVLSLFCFPYTTYIDDKAIFWRVEGLLIMLQISPFKIIHRYGWLTNICLN